MSRMVIEAGRHTIALDLHPRMTVITGIDASARESLATELLGSLGPCRPGVHVELCDDDGRNLAVFRPATGEARLIDVDGAVDITPTDGAPLDLYAMHGVRAEDAKRALRVTSADMATTTHADQVVQRLADIDQTALWAAAARVRVTDEALRAETTASGTGVEDAEMIDRVEHRHHRLEVARGTLARTRRIARMVTLVGLIACVPAVAFMPGAVIPLVALTATTLVAAFVYRARAARAEAAEQEALEAAGADSYLGFHVQRIDDLVSGDQARRRLLAAAADHRAAAAQWFDVAGDVSVEWAMDHHAEITTAARLRSDVRNLGVMSSGAPGDDDAVSAVAHTLLAHLARARSLGDGSRAFPVVIDEPFGALDPAHKAPLLELLERSAGRPQVVVLTEDEDVASWARLEALTGELSVLEPTPDAAPAEPPTPARANGVA